MEMYSLCPALAQVTSSSLSSLMLSLVLLPDLPERSLLPELGLPAWWFICSSFSSASWPPRGQLAPPS